MPAQRSDNSFRMESARPATAAVTTTSPDMPLDLRELCHKIGFSGVRPTSQGRYRRLGSLREPGRVEIWVPSGPGIPGLDNYTTEQLQKSAWR
jgi:hypothetical protein